jgi:hypothetical protein
MKKPLLVGALLLVLVIVLGIAGVVYAQSGGPTFPRPGFGPGMMGSGSGWGPGMMGRGGFGPVHTFMVEAFAEQVGLTVEQVNERLADGETMWEIAQAQGFSDEEIQDLMLQAHNEALDQAVAAGVLTQEQAEWMRQHMGQGWRGGSGPGSCHGGGGMRGGWRWSQPAPEA